ncbi:hypothetical protein [Nonomuraea sp. B5E05]|uniref:hypothetical protein n=1 Tax=Nonomuraea sp. B5E05 TaxID=3153569 RepID=UPI00326062B7
MTIAILYGKPGLPARADAGVRPSWPVVKAHVALAVTSAHLTRPVVTWLPWMRA